MKLSHKALAAALTLAFSSSAMADWSVSAAYNQFSGDAEYIRDISLGAATVGIGYEYTYSDSRFSFMPELRIGTGVKDDEGDFGIADAGIITVEIKTYTALSLRGQYEINDSVSVFVQPAYANLDVEVSALGESASDDEWDFGVGAGLIARANEQFSFEVSYERFDDTDVVSAGFRYHF
ncbi:outer membrane beta-barrel protein [Alteromonas antoniana]|uniref:outer membrane beta-barrel protein n=1 Tax=Alteromonas antoniana TaxID=2803813 RepID=UPI001C4485E7|nr:outer membrane beta-barrel protein [Alteromonas antoniana]